MVKISFVSSSIIKMEQQNPDGNEQGRQQEFTEEERQAMQGLVRLGGQQINNEIIEQAQLQGNDFYGLLEAVELYLLDNVSPIQNGLSPRRIRRFQIFSADETLVGEKCAICLEDINIGRRMRRLTCDGQHAFCPGCCETWFANKNTCPLCRHVFV